MSEAKIAYYEPWLIPAMNKFMGMQGFQLAGTQLVRFLVHKSNPVETPSLYYQDSAKARHVLVCTSGIAWGMENEQMTNFKMCPIKPQRVLPQAEPFELTYSNYPLCALYWRGSVAGQRWNGEQPFSDSYIAQGSLQWTLAIHETYKFSL